MGRPCPSLLTRSRKPKDFPEALARAWNRRCGQSIAALIAKDADFVNVSGLWWQGREAIAKPHDQLLRTAAFARTTLRPDQTRTRHLAEGLAQVACQFTLSGQLLTDGTPRGDRLWMVTAVLQQEKVRGWLALSAQVTGITSGREILIAKGWLAPNDHISPRDP